MDLKSGNKRDPTTSWNNIHSTPCQFSNSGSGTFSVIIDRFEEWEQKGSNNKLRNSTSKVTPSTDECIGSTNNIPCEHSRSPVLTWNESCTDETNEKTKNSKSQRAVDNSSQRSRDGTAAQKDGEKNT